MSLDARDIRIFDTEFPRGIGEVDRIIWKVVDGVKSVTVSGRDGRVHYIVDSIVDMRRRRDMMRANEAKLAS